MTSPLSRSAALFENGLHTYAILDAAGIPGLRRRLEDYNSEHLCLYRGDLEPEFLAVAPYLVRIEQGTVLTQWLLENGEGRNWGIFALSTLGLQTLSTHLRRFLIVTDPGGKKLYFRYYDPRVLRVYLPTCNEEELRMIFGEVERFVLEGESGVVLVFNK